MFLRLFLTLRSYGVPVTIREWLDLHHVVANNLCDYNVEAFYHLARSVLIKSESHFDKFDRAFSSYVADFDDEIFWQSEQSIPEEWLRKHFERSLSEEEKQAIESLGGFEQLMKTLQERLQEQKERHEGGNRWIGTGGTSPFGAYGYNPEGIRIGQDRSIHRRAVKVWDKRTFRGLDDEAVLDERNMALALKQLKARPDHQRRNVFNMDSTIKATAKNAGQLDLVYDCEKTFASDLIMLFDIGGSMDDHVHLTRKLFAQAKTAFNHLKFYYFHNCPYESLWTDARRRPQDTIETKAFLRATPRHYKLLLIGDASMSPYEILYAGGSVEHMNQEAGSVWLQRLISHFQRSAWLNPLPREHWHAQSIGMIAQHVDKKMFPMNVEGVAQAMKALN